MIIIIVPQVNELKKIHYDFTDEQTIKVSEYVISEIVNGTVYKKDVPELVGSDIFDFTDMPNGELEFYDADGNSLIETVLGNVPILNAKKEDGILTVEILFTIGIHEQDERLLFPEPMTVNEFNELMDELAESESEGWDES